MERAVIFSLHHNSIVLLIKICKLALGRIVVDFVQGTKRKSRKYRCFQASSASQMSTSNIICMPHISNPFRICLVIEQLMVTQQTVLRAVSGFVSRKLTLTQGNALEWKPRNIMSFYLQTLGFSFYQLQMFIFLCYSAI